jgi:hypothetical protein
MQTYSQTFAAGQTWVMNVPGRYFVILGCTLTVNVRFFKGGKKLDLGDISSLLAGLEVGPLDTEKGDPYAFDRVEVDVQAGDTVQVGIGNGAARYNRANATVTIGGGMNGAYAQAAATVTNVSAQLLAAKTTRRYVLIQNKDTAGNIYVNLAGVAATAANGIKVGPGGSLEVNAFCPTAAIFAIGDIGSNANIVTAEG